MREIYINANEEEPILTELTPQYLTSKFPCLMARHLN